jgi:hypothetical protein
MKARILLAALLCSAFSVATAGAQNRAPQAAPYDSWCRDMQTGFGGSVMICRTYTYQQCMASRSSHIENCYLNPLYDPRFADWRRRNPHY